jgi:hypothetical protein
MRYFTSRDVFTLPDGSSSLHDDHTYLSTIDVNTRNEKSEHVDDSDGKCSVLNVYVITVYFRKYSYSSVSQRRFSLHLLTTVAALISYYYSRNKHEEWHSWNNKNQTKRVAIIFTWKFVENMSSLDEQVTCWHGEITEYYLVKISACFMFSVAFGSRTNSLDCSLQSLTWTSNTIHRLTRCSLMERIVSQRTTIYCQVLDVLPCSVLFTKYARRCCSTVVTGWQRFS